MYGVRAAPVAYISAALALGIGVSELYGFDAVFKSLALLALLILILRFRFGRPSLTILILLLLVAVGATSWKVSSESVRSHYPAIDRLVHSHSDIDIDGLIIDEPKLLAGGFSSPSQAAYRFLVSVKSEGALRGTRMAVTLKQRAGDDRPRWGQLWRLHGTVARAEFPDNPGFENYLFHRRVVALFKVSEEDGAIVSEVSGPVARIAVPVRDFAARQAARYLPADSLALLMGVSLGDGSHLTDELSGKFRITGLSHMVVASGMNIAVVVACILVPLSAMSSPRWLRVLLGSTGAIAYVLIAGAQPSVTRAGVMAVTALILSLFFRRADLISLIATSALLLLALDPFSLFDLSFQLSYAATLGLALLLPLAGKLVAPLLRLLPAGRFQNWLGEALRVTLAAQMAVFPIILHNFGTLSPYTLPANIAAVPVSTFVLVAGLIAPIASFIWYPLGIIVYAPLNAALDYLIAVAEFFARLPAAGAAVEPLSGIAAIALALVTLALAYAAGKQVSFLRFILKFRWPVAALVMVFLMLLTGQAALNRSDPQRLHVIFLDVGQGDSALARVPGGGTILFDTGAPGNSVLSKLRQAGVQSIDLLVISHFHLDHAGEAASIIRDIPVGAVLAPLSIGAPTALRKEVEQAMKERMVRFIPAARGEIVKLGGSQKAGAVKAAVEIVTAKAESEEPARSRSAEAEENPNDGSVVARLSYGRSSFLFTGDLEGISQSEMMAEGVDVEASVLKVPHHGSRDSADESFMQKVRPLVSVISVGCRNSYHHPHKESVQLLERLGGRIYRTDRDGPVEIISDGRTISTQAKGSAHPCR